MHRVTSDEMLLGYSVCLSVINKTKATAFVIAFELMLRIELQISSRVDLDIKYKVRSNQIIDVI